MKVFCGYHPIKPAMWECSNCNENYCSSCVVKRVINTYGKSQTYYYCPKCNDQVNKLSVGNIIEPFWTRLPKIFLYPFSLRTLILIIGIAIAGLIFSGPGLLGGLIRVALWGILLKYSFAALKETANGKLVPPRITLETISDEFQVVFKQIGIFIIIFIVFGMIARSGGIILACLFFLFAYLSLPAMITVLVVSNSLLAACNPLIFVRMAWRIGWGYLLMYLFLVFLLSAPAVVGHHITNIFPNGLHLFLFSLASSYYTIITYHLMGYVMLQYHEEIGWDVDFDEELSSEENAYEAGPENEIINRVDMFIKDGDIDEAISFIREESGEHITDLNLAERYYKLLKVKQLNSEMLEHGKTYLDLIAKGKDWDKLCEVYSECASKEETFTPSPNTLFKIGGFLNERGNPKDAINVYSRFIKANPESPLIPKTYFLCANIFNEELNVPQKAIGILNGLIKRYPNSDIIPHAENYLKKVSC